ncbi:MAG: zinc ribbon domain-containing protein [Actinobacteria bacterium]|nr:zinc ribbon domain-containing protein [Actinomycetota bacterium]
MTACPSCGRENREDALYCVFCGVHLGKEEKGVGLPSPPSTGLVSPPPSKGAPGKRKARVLLWIIPAFLVLAAVVVALLLLRGGDGMTVAEYKEAVGKIHSRTGEEYEVLEAELEEIGAGMVEPGDPQELRQFIAGLETAEAKLEEFLHLLEESCEELQGLEPPKGVETFHREVLDFYERCQRWSEDLLSVAAYLREAFTLLASPMGTAAEFAESESASQQEFMNRLDDLEMKLKNSLDGLRDLDPPVSLRGWHERFLEVWNKLPAILSDARKATVEGDAQALSALDATMEEWGQECEALESELERAFEEIEAGLSALEEEAEDLDLRFQNL